MNDYLRYRQKLKLEGKPPQEKKRYKIAQYSKKRQAANSEYAEKSRPFWKDLPCQIKSPVCTGMAQGVHHRKGKATIKLLLDKRYWMRACNQCNSYVESHHEWAARLGFKLSRNNKE
jgi:hypothetical protein